MKFQFPWKKDRHDKLTREAIAYVNSLRAEYNIGEPLEDLPKGRKASVGSCPIAAALKEGTNMRVSVGTCDATLYLHPTDANGYRIQNVYLPLNVTNWIRNFDQGLYPEYLKGDR